MSTTLGYSSFDTNNNEDQNDKYQSRKQSMKNRTQKNRNPIENSSFRVESMMKQINSEMNNSEDTLEDFNPPPKPTSSGVEKMKQREDEKQKNDDSGVGVEGFQDINNNNQNSWSEDYYQQYLPIYTQSGNHINQQPEGNELLEKLNYMIHLLEEERDVKQGNVTEEVVLYCFLGVFVIFVVDSFAKVGKYVR
tara:strand:+ start:1516 stop:2094 length:579 start_codon:yes stop_codon:yes gene_type:complete